MLVYFCFNPAIHPDALLTIPSWGCFHLLVQFDWKALAALPAVPTGLPIYLLVSHLFGAGAVMQSFIYILHLTPRKCCFQQGRVSKIQQNFTSPSTRMYPSALLFSVSQMLARRAELVSQISGVNWDWKVLVSLPGLGWARVVVF